VAKTIKQIADEIGVSKQTVYKRYKGKLYTVCAPYAHTEQGVLYIEEQGETLIKQDFLQKECSIGAHTYAHTERSNGAVLEQSENAGVVAVLQTTIDTLQGQLAIKDKQIEELNARLAEVSSALVAAQQTAQAAQALHAGTIQQQLLSGESGADQQGREPEPGGKRSWFRKFFENR
jgi:AcrR family transcriptional regulator